MGLRNPRQVGRLLRQNPSPSFIPCYKVVRQDGSLASYAFGGKEAQKRLLQKEGIEFKGYSVKNIDTRLYIPTFFEALYVRLVSHFGLPGPWPWYEKETKRHTREEIVLGAVLTQNINWVNAQKALDNLREHNLNTLEGVLATPLPKLQKLIKPAGFYERKARTLKSLARLILDHQGLSGFKKDRHKREKLLSVVGIGEETADTILLYALSIPSFVIDEYTRRLLRSLSFPGPFTYSSLKRTFEDNLPRKLKLYQDFHALIVRWGKEKEKPKLGLSWESF